MLTNVASHMQVATRKKVRDFLASHTAYELIPESGKVVLIDVDFSVRKAFHALSEQGIASAPLWDRAAQDVVGMISASDFIETLKQLRDTASSGGALTDSEMDAHTIRATRLLAAAAGAPSRPLVACHENDSFATVRSRAFHAVRAWAVVGSMAGGPAGDHSGSCRLP